MKNPYKDHTTFESVHPDFVKANRAFLVPRSKTPQKAAEIVRVGDYSLTKTASGRWTCCSRWGFASNEGRYFRHVQAFYRSDHTRQVIEGLVRLGILSEEARDAAFAKMREIQENEDRATDFDHVLDAVEENGPSLVRKWIRDIVAAQS